MAGMLPADSSHHSTSDSGPSRNSPEKQEEVGRWYFSRKEIEENSPSRMDGIDLKKETYLRKSYCTFLQDLGMRLKVPQVTIATAIIFCHRFFIRQSHAKNDRRTVATVCMFLAGKVEETPRPLKDVILVSYEIIHKNDPSATQRIKHKEVYEQQKELILLGERVVLATLGFDFNVHHPYKPLVEAIKKFKVAQNALAQVAWNFVNDGLRTSLCLQFKPHHIAAGAIFLAAKFLKVKLPSDGEKVWWQEFDVTPRQLEEVSNQMLELYEQNRVPPSQGSEVEGSAGGGTSHRAPANILLEVRKNKFHHGLEPTTLLRIIMWCHQKLHKIKGMMMGVERWAVLLLITRWMQKPRRINIMNNCPQRRTQGRFQINLGPEWSELGEKIRKEPVEEMKMLKQVSGEMMDHHVRLAVWLDETWTLEKGQLSSLPKKLLKSTKIR
ncbi:Cyclin-T1-4 [Hibiscus syriacus]|uniref:Cyclin-T1-4 n=1 Tax=Hibiscus syriacus TaxID=106335 RepID=A0A6A2ZYR2_HIBSY|nr:Cyclin-T1-4 [Hibiscus syriacus]